MRAVVLAVLTLASPALAAAQDTAIVINPESTTAGVVPREIPRPVAEEAVRFFNAATTTRLVGRSRLPLGNEWRGDVAVRNGSVDLAGRIQGSLLVINGDATLDSTAEITGDVTVVGGTLARAPGAHIGGAVRAYREPFLYRSNGEEIALAPHPRRRIPFLGARKTWAGTESYSSLTLATGGTYNRVEGLPVVFGPEFAWRVREGFGVRLDALGILRSVGSLTGQPGNLGYIVNSEVRSGSPRGVGAGLRAYSVVAPIESWGLTSTEVGWAAFLFQRDYRDYDFSRGLRGRLFAQPLEPLTLSVELTYDWEASVAARDPWTLTRNRDRWRSNPPIDAGHYTTLTGAVALDTRNDRDQPTAGWLLEAQLDNGWSPDVSPQTLPVAVRRPIPTDGSYQFRRLFLDLRRYTRVSPSGRVNFRVLAGGWLGGDPLPLQQRLSIGGSAPLPGYGFRRTACHDDITDAAFAGTQVAACDRVLLTQVEYRGHLSLHWSYGRSRPEDEAAKSPLTLQGPDLVVFGDAGQAWLVGKGPGRLPSDRLPTLRSWLADLGLGMDWAGFGVYVAKAVTSGEPLRFTVRLDHRF
jgi:surface antigen Omp85-like protein